MSYHQLVNQAVANFPIAEDEEGDESYMAKRHSAAISIINMIFEKFATPELAEWVSTFLDEHPPAFKATSSVESY